MSAKKGICQVARCQRLASALCFCCQNNVCTSHMLEHIKQMKTKLDPLENEVTSTMERIRSFTLEQLSGPVLTQLNQWRKEMHDFIDEIHQSETKAIEDLLQVNRRKFADYKREQSDAVTNLQRDVKRLLEDGDVTFEQIESFKNQLKEIQTNWITFEKNFLAIHTPDLPNRLLMVSSRVNEPSEPISSTKFQQPTTRGKFPKLISLSFIVVSALETPPSGQPKPFRSSISVRQDIRLQGSLSQTSARFVTAPSVVSSSNAKPLTSSGPTSNPFAEALSIAPRSTLSGAVVPRLRTGNQYPSDSRKSAPATSWFNADTAYADQGKTNSTTTAARSSLDAARLQLSERESFLF